MVDEPGVCLFYEECIAAIKEPAPSGAGLAEAKAGKQAANMVLQLGGKHANLKGTSVEKLGITPGQIAGIVALREANKIGSTAADELFGLLCETGESAEQVASAKGLLQVTDMGAIEGWVREALAANPKAVESIRAGKMNAIGSIVGAVMKASGGKADAKAVGDLVRKELGVQG